LDKCIGGMETPRWLGASGQLRVNARRPAVSELIVRFGPAKASRIGQEGEHGGGRRRDVTLAAND
jgi:hypothetical protein